jgi:hypothetical protein
MAIPVLSLVAIEAKYGGIFDVQMPGSVRKAEAN